tara:strand:+ start:9603 stop:10343 length:741 start_codon:yes stop_codon:yes gene_type:complete
MKKRAVILGAKSAIARSLAVKLAAQGYELILAARNSQDLQPFASDLQIRYSSKSFLIDFDALNTNGLCSLPQRLEKLSGPIDLAILVFGYLGNHDQAEKDTNEMKKIFDSNFTSAAIILGHLANYFEEKEHGGIIGISSVAGDRGRQSNYLYGASKGALSIFLQGLRNRLQKKGIHVLTVKPGFVDTPMIKGVNGLFLVATPDRVAEDILRAYRKKRDVIYTPWFWRWILVFIRFIPERIFKRLSL